jgi:hypothetical protein
MTEYLFWDSCVFIAFLKDQRSFYDVVSIERYLKDAQERRVVIFASSLVFAEILPSFTAGDARPYHGDVEAFMDDFSGCIRLIDPDPNIMRIAGRLRDLPYKKGRSEDRRLSTADAVMLASALVLVEYYNQDLTYFHTYDKGGKRDEEGGRAIPLIGYEEWCEGFDEIGYDRTHYAYSAIALNRCEPSHPTPQIELDLRSPQ